VSGDKSSEHYGRLHFIKEMLDYTFFIIGILVAIPLSGLASINIVLALNTKSEIVLGIAFIIILVVIVLLISNILRFYTNVFIESL